MKAVARMSVLELAAMVSETLRKFGIEATLTGGGCVAIWSNGEFVSRDLDFVEEGPVTRHQLKRALSSIRFTEKDRYFVHPDTQFFIEFPTGPLMVGDERIESVAHIETETGCLRLLSPTDCVKDRLAAFFFWADREALGQALLVAQHRSVDVNNIKRWARREGRRSELDEFLEMLRAS